MLSLALYLKAKESFVTEYVGLGHQTAVIYTSDSVAKTGIGIVVMHSNEDYTGFIANSELASRGHTVIATIPPNTHDIGSKLKYVGNCVEYLRKKTDIHKVLLLGHSGGATIMSAYQMLAENGRQVIRDKLYDGYSSEIDSLPVADGLLLLDANYGLSTMALISLDPNVKIQDRGTGVDEVLNPGNPAVGYSPNGNTQYTTRFISRYNSAQAKRMNLLSELALSGLNKVEAGVGAFDNDEPFIVAGADQMKFFNKLILQDTTLLSHTVGKWPLLHSDGTISDGIVHCVRRPMPYTNKTADYSDAVVTTVRGWLSSYAIRVSENFRILTDTIEGVDWKSNINNPIGNIAYVRCPSLFMGMTGSYEYLASEIIYNNSASIDKTIVFAEGAGHMLEPDQPKYDGITGAIFDYIDAWLRSRFSSDNSKNDLDQTKFQQEMMKETSKGPKLGSRSRGPVIDKSSDAVLQGMIKDILPEFRSFEYTDSKTGKSMTYHLFTPNNLDTLKKYPLVMFIADASTAGAFANTPLTQGYGGLIWATKESQEENPCFVLVPHYSGVAVDDNYDYTDEVDMTIRLLNEVVNSNAIDDKRLYTTGQSMGGMMSMYFNVAYPNVFAASIFVDSHWATETFNELVKQKFVWFIAGGEGKAYPELKPLEEAAEKEGFRYSYATWSAKLPETRQDELAKKMLDKNAPINIIQFETGSVLPKGINDADHMYSFDYAYRIKSVRDWMFKQVK